MSRWKQKFTISQIVVTLLDNMWVYVIITIIFTIREFKEVKIALREWLKKLREDAGLSQKELADKLGISESYYFYIEAGTRQKRMDLSLAKKIAEIFCLEISQIVEFEDKLEQEEAE